MLLTDNSLFLSPSSRDKAKYLIPEIIISAEVWEKPSVSEFYVGKKGHIVLDDAQC